MSARRPRYVRRLLAVLASLAVLALVYLIIGSLVLGALLRTRARAANAELDYAWAYTLYPGQLEVRELSLNGSTWSVLVSSLSARFSILELAQGTLAFENVEATGADVRLRAPRARPTAERPSSVTFSRAGFMPAASLIGNDGPIHVRGFEAGVSRISMGNYELSGAIEISGRQLSVLPGASAPVLAANGELRVASPTALRVRESGSVRALLPRGAQLHAAPLSGEGGFSWVLDVPEATAPQSVQVRKLHVRLDSPGALLECDARPSTLTVNIAALSRLGSLVASTGRIMADFQVPRWCLGSDALSVSEGNVELTALRLHARERARASTQLSATLSGVSGHFSPGWTYDVLGRFEIAGPDAGALIRNLELNPALSLMFSRVSGQSFMAHGVARLSSRGTWLKDVRVNSADLKARARASFVGGRTRGDILLQLAGLSVGVEIDGAQRSVVLEPAADWATERFVSE